MKKLIFLLFLGLSLSWIPPGNATNVAKKGTAVEMAKNFIGIQPVMISPVEIDMGECINHQSLVANKNVATKENSHKRRVEFMVGVLSFKRPAKLTSSVLNLDSKNQPKDVATIMQSKTPASQPASNQPEYTGSVA